MSKKKQSDFAVSYTDNGERSFKCRSCGVRTREDIRYWKKKKTKDKNICFQCIRNRKLARETAEERAKYDPAPYLFSTFLKK